MMALRQGLAASPSVQDNSKDLFGSQRRRPGIALQTVGEPKVLALVGSAPLRPSWATACLYTEACMCPRDPKSELIVRRAIGCLPGSGTAAGCVHRLGSGLWTLTPRDEDT